MDVSKQLQAACEKLQQENQQLKLGMHQGRTMQGSSQQQLAMMHNDRALQPSPRGQNRVVRF